MPGKGNVKLSGSLGDVMKESSSVAFSLVRSLSREIGIDPIQFENQDFHVHVPSGAIPKDGPSAGVTMLTSMVSLLLDLPVNPSLAMTGEITLRGAVLPVGGIKEKVLAAHRAGVKTLILPNKNRKDLPEIPEYIQKELTIHFCEHVRDVLKVALNIEMQ
jgi:ATP-dependent Lon protease